MGFFKLLKRLIQALTQDSAMLTATLSGMKTLKEEIEKQNKELKDENLLLRKRLIEIDILQHRYTQLEIQEQICQSELQEMRGQFKVVWSELMLKRDK